MGGGGEEEEEEDRGSMSPSKDYLALHPSLQQTTFFLFFSFPIPSCFGLLPPWQLYKATD